MSHCSAVDDSTFSLVSLLRLGQVGLLSLALSVGCKPADESEQPQGNAKTPAGAASSSPGSNQQGTPQPVQALPAGQPAPLEPPSLPSFDTPAAPAGNDAAPAALPQGTPETLPPLTPEGPAKATPPGAPSNWPAEGGSALPLSEKPNPLRKATSPGLRDNPIRPDLPSREPSPSHDPLPPPPPRDPLSPGEGLRVPPNGPIGSPAALPPHDASLAPLSPPPPAVPTGLDADKKPFDPIKENGPIFVDWPTPKLAILITGREDGYMEPCGCAGLDRMKGGMSRRHTLIETLRDEKHWPLVCVDAGGLSKGFGVQTEIKFRYTVEAMRKMRYNAIAFGKNDLMLPAGELVSVAADPSPDDPSPFVSANVGLIDMASGVTARSRIVKQGGVTVGITSVLGKEYQRELHNQEVEVVDPARAIAEVLPKLKKECNLLILLAHATKEESIQLAQQFPDFRLVVTAGGSPSVPEKPERIEKTQSLLIEVGEKGMDAVVLGIFDDPKNPVRYQRVPLDSRFPASRDIKRLMVAYQEELKLLGLEGLRVKAVSHPDEEPNGAFVGSKKCESCHEESYRVWKKSKHAHAWQTLKETDPPRNHDPQCISCHVVGWHPTQYFPYKSGFLSESTTPEKVNVGCESCHGPGAAHCAAEEGSNTALQEKLQKAMVVTKEQSQKDHAKWCQNCHDLDNSPEFNFETYWPQVEHKEE